ncbi:TPA: ABC transporter permease [Streptococcus pneumoniae]|uniref:ABC transporter permease n=1 Tax=Streptococcus pneumoniae TaxID=1313 RepID=UPI0002735BAF|nr:ABC transporter permease [Streptococcus pneumoniae]EJG82644.1 ftsX-like permease family protein [Streptococcus pneumoniae SPAR95]CTP30512.1 ABC transporter, permease protein [Streptococcus pneumoniae]CTP64287.1 ABC transporter, permease protein [Streptococcus pneumoniae]SNG12786.1 ABC transporter, membrane-spanning protein [Streptococcus pneumoniae]VJR71610.1 ABC transporter, membrane-spanning protein [Streptococcus pneumoniae]
MFRLTNKLAVSNLIKNRKLYYPFALAVLLAVTVTYLFYSLTFNPKIAEIRGGTTIQATLGFGMFVVTLASAIIVLYANSFVMKNRSKELGIYGMLGLEKRHLISMTFKELVVFGILTVGAGIGIGALFDKLIFAFLLKLMKLKVELVATFQMNVVIAVLVVFGLIFRMKKNAVGLATIAILSTMVLVTMSAATSIFNSAESFKKVLNPHDFGVSGQNVEKEDLDKLLSQFASDKGYSVKEKEVLRYSNFGIANQEGTKLTIFEKGQNRVQPTTVFMVFDQKDYENMTGQKLSLSGNEVGLFAKNDGLKGQKALTLNDHQFSVKEEFNKDFIVNHVPNKFNILTTDYNYLVVPDLQAFLDQFPDSAIYNQFYGGMNVNVSEEEQLKVAEEYENYLNQFNAQLDTEGSYVYGSNLADASSQMSALFGGVFFIGIFLSIIFMVGTVLVIYYKQISEGYEDRERFIILQKVGLDQKQIKQTINKQVLTVFFLPLLFAFIHLAFAYHMLSLILKVIGVLDTTMMLIVTLSICAIFLIAYVLIFMITSRSYRKIVQM